MGKLVLHQNDSPDGHYETELSLFLGFPRGDALELRRAAAIAVAWVDAVEQMLRDVEPGLAVRIDLIDGEEGSLSLNTILRMAETGLERIARGSRAYPRLKALAVGLAIVIGSAAVDWTVQEILDAIFEEDEELSELTDEEKLETARIIERALKDESAEQARDKFSREVSRTEKLETVGVATAHNRKPHRVVSREKHRLFLERERASDGDSRSRLIEREVVLISPVLENAERSWKFREPGMPEFGAIMRDREFLDAVGRGAVHEELRFGIPMIIEIEVVERKRGEIWATESRNVVRVISPSVDRSDLFSSTS